ncbi:Os12g0549050 [Oryza sativa Japonica Group]|uniref:Os12g0549050 protein n=1 Tax=Oryza sativa subsp. japonica TaxID=39947 RepID=A0A0P0YB65_ORYSJ|nr:Os12g0549050 [Oryza sativa Japonica Group]
MGTGKEVPSLAVTPTVASQGGTEENEERKGRGKEERGKGVGGATTAAPPSPVAATRADVAGEHSLGAVRLQCRRPWRAARESLHFHEYRDNKTF